MYQKELDVIDKANLFRERKIYSHQLFDFASNDYLGLADDKKLLKLAYNRLKDANYHSPKASMLVNGYSKIHYDFEEYLKKESGYEGAIVVGSGFLANIALIETLIRKDTELFIDSAYHASGILASKLTQGKVSIFKHNEPENLRELLISSSANRKVVAIEGVYSMSGELANRDIFSVAKEFDCYLIIDEAHSCGVIGDKLLGILDYYNIKVEPKFIKLGTLGKAYGSYGAYILASSEIIKFLENRAKPIIYSTAPSLFDIALAHFSSQKIAKNRDKIKNKISSRQELIKNSIGIDIKSLILPIEIPSNEDVLKIQKELLESGFLVGAIRYPTVPKPILRIIPKIDLKKAHLKTLLRLVKEKL